MQFTWETLHLDALHFHFMLSEIVKKMRWKFLAVKNIYD